MIGAQMLINIHKRLQEIMENTQPFFFWGGGGGVSILAVGDLMQLPPVGDSAVFAEPVDPIQRLNMSIWQKHFRLLELTEIQRQKNDHEFANILNRIRIGSHTSADLDFLCTQNNISSDIQSDCLTVYPTNRQVNLHNEQCLSRLSDMINIKCQDSIESKQA